LGFTSFEIRNSTTIRKFEVAAARLIIIASGQDGEVLAGRGFSFCFCLCFCFCLRGNQRGSQDQTGSVSLGT